MSRERTGQELGAGKLAYLLSLNRRQLDHVHSDHVTIGEDGVNDSHGLVPGQTTRFGRSGTRNHARIQAIDVYCEVGGSTDRRQRFAELVETAGILVKGVGWEKRNRIAVLTDIQLEGTWIQY